jgi:ribokinase
MLVIVGTVGVCGSVNMDVSGYVARLPDPGATVLGHDLRYAVGGKGANQAVAASRMGAEVVFVGARGTDDFGARAAAAVAEAGVNVEHLAAVDAPTGVALILVADDGENQIVVVPGANDRATGPPADVRADVWLTQAEIPPPAVAATLAAARRNGATAVVNPSPSGRLDPELVAQFDIAVVNRGELDQLGGWRPAVVVLTLGADGVELLPSGERIAALPALAVDTTGAGDAFTGALAAGLAEGLRLPDAACLGVAAAAICVEGNGAMPSMPTRSQVADRLAATSRGGGGSPKAAG